MKLNVFLSVMSMTLCGSALADNVELKINGYIQVSTCQVSEVNTSVNLGDNILSTSLRAPQSGSAWKRFDINLKTCPSGKTKATVTFSGTADSDNPDDMYKNTGTAKNIAIQLQSVEGDKLGNGKTYTATISRNQATYQLQARAYSHAGGAQSGSISTEVTLGFTYQ